MKLLLVLVTLGFVAIGAQAQARCKEGTTKIFMDGPESDQGSNKAIERTCHNGSYYPITRPVVYHSAEGCKEGTTKIFFDGPESDQGSNKAIERTCHNGSYYQIKRPVVYRACVEGRTEMFLEDDGGEDSHLVHYTCRHGQLKRDY